MQKHPYMFTRLMRLILGRRKDRDDEARTTEETVKKAAEQPKAEGPQASAKSKQKKTRQKQSEKTAS